MQSAFARLPLAVAVVAVTAGSFAAGWVTMLPLVDYAAEHFAGSSGGKGTARSGPWSTRLDLARSDTPATVRAYVAQIGIAANQAEEALYWNAFADSRGGPLDGRHAYEVRFAGRPPVVQDAGFWSLTAYDADSYLVANPERRYAFGDRSLIQKRDDGSFVLGVSSQKPAADSGNWLPCPPAGRFSLTLRMYVPTRDTLEHPQGTAMPEIACLDCE